jgi:uncharacterized protein YndB with AHSA1/START domain
MRYILIALGAIIALVLIVAIVGWSLPVGHKASIARTYRATPAALFSLITDVTAFPSWRTGVTRVQALPDESGRKRWIETTKDGSSITYVAEQMVPDRLLVSRIADRNLPFGGAWTYELTPVGEGTTSLRVTEDGEVYNPIFRFVSRFVMGHDATMRQYLAAVGKRFPEVSSDAPRRI